MSKEKARALQAAIKQTEKTFGAGVAIQLGKNNPFPDVLAFSTGSIAVDLLSTCHGFPRSLITELFGPEGAGKSTLALHAVANAQAQGENAIYIDAEQAFSPSYARACGVDTEKMVITQPDYGEQGLLVLETFIDSGSIGIAVVDSVAMLTPRSEMDREMGDPVVGDLSRMMSNALRKLTVKVRKQNVALIFINQIRDRVGVTYGEKTTTPGGHSLKHIASLRLHVQKISALKIGDKVVGSRTRVRNPKSRVGDPYQEAEFDLIFGHGVSREGDLIDVATKLGVVQKEGANYSFRGERIGMLGREKAKVFLAECPDMFAEIRELVMQAVNGKPK